MSTPSSEQPAVPGSSGNAPIDRVLLVGGANVGKSVFFGLMTGTYVVVSNYPGTTVELTRGRGSIGGREVEVIDTPGANSLSPNSEDEKVTRDVVLAPGAKTVVQIGDAKNLRRALFLTTQLAEYETPSILVLNMWDEAQDRGIEIDFAAVERAVGVPVVAAVATERRNLAKVVSSIERAAVSTFMPRYGRLLEAGISEVGRLLEGLVETGRRGYAVALLSGAPALQRNLAARAAPGFVEELDRIRSRLAARYEEPLGLVIARRRAMHADILVEEAVTASQERADGAGWRRAAAFFVLLPTLFYAIGWRLASLALVASSGGPRIGALGATATVAICHALGFVSLALYSASAFRRDYASAQSGTFALARLATHPVGGLPILLAILWAMYIVVGVLGAGECVDLLEERLLGTFDAETREYGGVVNRWLSRGAALLFGRDTLVYAFFFDPTAGVISVGVTYAVAIAFPIVTLFFVAFALMEDSGYLPRLALLVDRAFKRLGLSGKAVLPMVLGLGCGTMATMTTRILETRKQRLIAILLLSLVVPCSAQLGIIASALSGISAGGAVVYLVTIGLVVAGVGFAAARVIPGGDADFLIEIPPMRVPGLKNVVVKTYHRVKWFMREAVPLFMAGTVFLFVTARIGLLGIIEWAARPLVGGLLGLPDETARGFIMGFLRRDYGAVIIFTQFRDGLMGANQALVALVVITLFVPCLAHFFVCAKELGWRRALLMNAFVFAVAFAVGGLVRAVLAVTGLNVAAA